MNLELANKVLDQITARPESHYQATWINEGDGPGTLGDNICGTQACVAGWTVALAGNTIQVNAGETFRSRLINGEYFGTFFRDDWAENQEEYLDMLRASDEYKPDLRYYEELVEEGMVEPSSSWSLVAARLLGIPIDVADRLFSGNNSEAEAREMLRDLIDQATAEEKRKAEDGEFGRDATEDFAEA